MIAERPSLKVRRSKSFVVDDDDNAHDHGNVVVTPYRLLAFRRIVVVAACRASASGLSSEGRLVSAD